jgi:hypothetical protein
MADSQSQMVHLLNEEIQETPKSVMSTMIKSRSQT